MRSRSAARRSLSDATEDESRVMQMRWRKELSSSCEEDAQPPVRTDKRRRAENAGTDTLRVNRSQSERSYVYYSGRKSFRTQHHLIRVSVRFDPRQYLGFQWHRRLMFWAVVFFFRRACGCTQLHEKLQEPSPTPPAHLPEPPFSSPPPPLARSPLPLLVLTTEKS